MRPLGTGPSFSACRRRRSRTGAAQASGRRTCGRLLWQGRPVAASDPVQEQLDAYNARDLDRFLGCYASNVVVRSGEGRVLLEGIGAVGRRYGDMFARDASLNAVVTGRFRAGGWTVDEEHVTIDGIERHVLVGYRVVGRLIRDVVMMRSDEF